MDIKEKIKSFFVANSYQPTKIDKLALFLSIKKVELERELDKLEDETFVIVTNGLVFFYGPSKYYNIALVDHTKRSPIATDIYDSENSFSLPPNYFLHQDIILVYNGEVYKTVKHQLSSFYVMQSDKVLKCINYQMMQTIELDKSSEIDEGDILLVDFIYYDYDKNIVKVKLIKNLGAKVSAIVESLILDKDLELNFSKDVISEAKKLEYLEPTDKNRVDLRELPFVTIDGDGAKDFDDAILVEKVDGGYRLRVAIAEVSYYVTKDSFIDKEARKRTSSLYVANFVLPMLPFALSDDLCSLLPDHSRLAIVTTIDFNKNLDIIKVTIEKAIIKSRSRLTYSAVNKFFNNEETFHSKELERMLNNALELSNLLEKRRAEKGALKINSLEKEFDIVDDQVTNIKLRESSSSESLIEMFMVITNEVTASFVFNNNVESIYRVHPEPTLSRHKDLILEGKHFAYSLKPTPDPIDYQQFINKYQSTDSEFIVSSLVQRALSKAVYSTKNIGHFGLGSDCYTHATSPIRRYSDLIVQRLLKAIIDNDHQAFYQSLELNEIIDHINFKERSLVDIERLGDKLLSARYLKANLLDSYQGIIVGIINSGIFVEFDRYYEGFIPLRVLKEHYNERYISISENNMRLTGNKINLGIGDVIKVKVDKINLNDGTIDLWIS